MEKKKIDIGSFITSKTVHQPHASGHVTAILTNTIVIIDNEKQTHLIEKKTLKSNGYSISKKLTQLKTNQNPMGVVTKETIKVDSVKKTTGRSYREPKKPKKEVKIVTIPDHVLIDKLKKMTEEIGKIPISKNFPDARIAISQFGSWKKFLDVAGIKASRHIYSNDFLLKEINLLAKKLNRTPRTTEFPHYDVVLRRYGSWNDFLTTANLPLNVNSSQMPKEYFINEINLLAQQLNRVPVYRDYSKANTAAKKFGSWNKFLDAAGLDRKKQDKSHLKRNIYSNEELLNKFNLLTEELGRVPRVREFRHYRIASKRFGSWNNFLEAANATPIKKYTKLSNEQFIEDIQLLARQLNRTPVFRDYPKAKVAADRFGSWNKFLEVAGIKKENQKE